MLLWLFVLFEYSSSFQANTRIVASKKKILVALSLEMIFKSNFFLLLEYSGHEYILDCYSSTNTSTNFVFVLMYSIFFFFITFLYNNFWDLKTFFNKSKYVNSLFCQNISCHRHFSFLVANAFGMVRCIS